MGKRICRAKANTVVALLLLLVFAGLGSLWISHRPSSPSDYAEDALAILANGYYAQGEDWDNAKANVLDSVSEAESIEELYVPLIEATRVAGGKHSSFQTPEKALEFQNQSAERFELPKVTTNTGVTVVSIPMISSASAEEETAYVNEAAFGIDNASAQTCGWVVDLRGNRGGNMWPMLAAVSPLLPNGPAMAFVTSDGQSSSVAIDGAATALNGEVLSEGPDVKKVIDTPIAVLQDKDTASSGEAVLLAFKDLPKVRTFGEASAGYSSANSVYTLADGAQIVLTEATYADRSGNNTEGVPLEPDVASSLSLTFDVAVEWLSDEGCP